MSLATLRTGVLESLIHVLDRVPAKHPEAEHLKTGRDGELDAFFYLRRLGYIVVARDWKSSRSPGDIDLVAWEGETLCFVEVKTRSSRDVAKAEAAVDEHKRKILRRMASHYLRQLPEDTPSRFDVLSIYYTAKGETRRGGGTEIALFRSAFDWSEEQDRLRG